MSGILSRDTFQDIAPGDVAGQVGSGFDGGGTRPEAFTVQETREGSNPLGLAWRYGNWKRTVSASGFVIHTIVGGPVGTLRRYRWYQTMVAAPSVTTTTMQTSSGATQRCQLLTSTTRTVVLRNSTTQVGVPSGAMVLGRRYRFEWLDDPPNSQQRLVVYEPDETTVFYDSGLVAAPAAASTRTQVRLGNLVACTIEIDYAFWVESDQAAEVGPVNGPFGFAAAA